MSKGYAEPASSGPYARAGPGGMRTEEMMPPLARYGRADPAPQLSITGELSLDVGVADELALRA